VDSPARRVWPTAKKRRTEFLLRPLAHACPNLTSVSSSGLKVPSSFLSFLLLVTLCQQSSFLHRSNLVFSFAESIEPPRLHALFFLLRFYSLLLWRFSFSYLLFSRKHAGLILSSPLSSSVLFLPLRVPFLRPFFWNRVRSSLFFRTRARVQLPRPDSQTCH